MAGIPDVAANAGFSQNLINEAQRNLIKAAIRAGVGMTIGGEDPGLALTSALRLAAADTVGAVLANEIGDLAAFNGLKEGSIEKVVLHAAVGCAAATIGSGECMAGAIGSGLAELIGKPLAEPIPDPARQTALLSLIAGAAGAIAGGSADALNAAASQAATTHQNNYLNHAEEQEFTQALAACQRGDQSACQRADALRELSDQRDQTLEACVGQGSQACVAARLELRIAAAEFLDAALKAGGDSLDERALMGRHMLFLQAWQHADDTDLAGGTQVAALAQRFQSEEARKLITGSKQDIESVVLDPILLGVILAGGHGNGKQIVGGGTGGSKGNGSVKPGQGETLDGGVPSAALEVKTQIAPKIQRQMGRRGWDTAAIEDTISQAARKVATRDTRHNAQTGTRNNDPATAYINKDGSYVVRNDRTGDIVQVSDRTDPDWKSPF